MKIRLLFLAIAIVAVQPAKCQQARLDISEIFPVDGSHSYVGFSIQYMGYAMVRGRFNELIGAIHFNEKDLTQTSITLAINVSSIDTGDRWRDNDLRSDNWFNESEYPQIRFVSTKTELTTGGVLISGKLTMHGITKSISVPLARPIGVVKDVRGDSQIIFTGSLIINRKDFGIEGKNWAGVVAGITAVSDYANVELTILGKRINAGNFQNWVMDTKTPHGKIYNAAKVQGVAKALLAFDSILATSPAKLEVHSLNTAGQMLLKENRVKEALMLFKKNIEAYPRMPIVYESYGEALAAAGQYDEALIFYKKALDQDEWSVVAREAIRAMEKKSSD